MLGNWKGEEMSAELFNAEETPFNLAGEQIDNATSEEGEKRVRALAEAEASKAQKLLFAPATTSERADVALASGRVIVHRLQPNGSQLAYMADGGTMSDDEWTEYCGKISTRAIRWPKQIL